MLFSGFACGVKFLRINTSKGKTMYNTSTICPAEGVVLGIFRLVVPSFIFSDGTANPKPLLIDLSGGVQFV